MDLDAYVAAHGSEWRRLEDLTRKRRLSGAEADELVDRYQQVATHLSVVRTAAPDPTLVAHLSSLLSRARNRAVGTRTGTWRGVGGGHGGDAARSAAVVSRGMGGPGGRRPGIGRRQCRAQGGHHARPGRARERGFGSSPSCEVHARTAPPGPWM